MGIRKQPRCKCGKFLADFGRIHADETPACDIWRKCNDQNGVQIVSPGPYDVYSDSDGHYVVMAADRKIMHYELAHDYACMKAIQLNRQHRDKSLWNEPAPTDAGWPGAGFTR